jgi:MFS family permease
MQFVFTPIWGRLSDRFGRRPLILLSLAGSCTGFLIFGLARTLPGLFLGRMVAGIAGAIIPTTQAYIADVTTPENRARGMGLIGAAFGLGFILGPAIGGLLAPYGYDKPSFFAAAMAAANFAFAYFRLPESLTEETRHRTGNRRFDFQTLVDALTHPHIGLLLAIFFVVTFGFSNMEATFGLLNEHLYGLSVRQTGYLFTLIGIIASIMQGALVGRIVKRFGEARCVSAGTFLMIFGLGLMPFAGNMLIYCIIISLVAIGSGVNNPALSASLSKATDPDKQGGIMGIAQSISSLGRILGPMWGGYTWGTFGPRAPFITAGLLMTLAFLLSLRNLSSE